MSDDWEGKAIYLSHPNDTEFVGLHSTGMTDENGVWRSMEAWLNVYGPDRKFQYSASRIFGPIEEEAENMKQEGWQVVNDWKD